MATATSIAYGAAGQMLIPIPVAGAIIGSFVGYTLTTMVYGSFMKIIMHGGLIKAMNEAKLAKEERIRIEKEAEEIIKQIRAYRQEFNKYMDLYIKDYSIAFDKAFYNIKSSIQMGDADKFIDGVNQITYKLGGQVQFNNMNEFEKLMESDEPFIL